MSAIRLSASVRFPNSLRTVFALLALVSLTVGFLVLPERFLLTAEANNTTQALPFSQNWTNIGLITVDDDWSSVPGIIGYRGDNLTASPGNDPRTILADGSATPVDVNANQTNPAGFATGGVAEFHIANPTIALQGSGTADAPHVVFYLNTSGASNILVSYNVRDIDGSADNAIQQVALQYRVGSTGNFTNLPAGYVADATTGGTATQVTPVSVTLPAACNNQPQVQVRVITADAAGSDEWVGIDDISVIAGATPLSGVGAATPDSVNAGASSLLTVAVTPATNPPSTNIGVSADLSAIGGSATQTFYDDASHGDATPGDGIFSYSATVAGGTSGGAKSLTFSVTDAENRNASGNISLTVQAPTNPGGSGTASPNPVAAGSTTLLTFNVTPGTNPPSTGMSVSGNLSDIGGSANQAFADNGSNSFSYLATVDAGTTGGIKSLPISITDAEGRTGSGSISLTVQAPANHLTISQLYGGGGNASATYKNDFVELYNPTASPINTGGWTIQYASATGDAWTNKQPLGGIIGPGEYYLISLASGGNVGADLPPANILGEINMSGTTGKLALVKNGTALTGACPTSNPNVVDFVGYGGTANCREGSTNAPAPNNQNAIFRKGSGAIDTDSNGDDFVTGTANPRITTPIQEIGPWVLSTDPGFDGFNAPKDATIVVDFTEAVTVDAGWYDITCASGQHNDATLRSTNNGKSWAITPNVNFVPGEQCTVTVFKTSIHDVDTDDSAPDTDMLTEDYVWSFTVATGLPAPYPPGVHLTMGNPSDAVADTNEPNNYLMEKAGFVLSYNRDKGIPNWVSWHLENTWTGNLQRFDTFRADPAVPSDWYRVQGFDYESAGFDRGHMTPNADRDHEARIPINQETFLMTNMIPQAADNNQGPWAAFENFLRTLTDGGSELYIVSGGVGVGGTGSNGFRTTITNGHVTVPAHTWKVVLVIPKGDNDVDRVGASTRTIAVKMPNVQGIRQTNWTNYLTTVKAVEADTGYDFFENVPDAIENAIEAGTDGANPPGTANQTVSTTEDNAVLFTLNAVSPSASPLTVTPVTSPSFGGINCVNISCTYTPASNFNGVDSFSYTVSNANGTSNTSTVTLNVGAVPDAPTASSNSVSQSVQYSDAIQNVTISASDPDSHPLTASSTFTKDGGSSQSGLPANLSLSAASCAAAGGGTSCMWTISGTADTAPGTYAITVTVSDGGLQTTTSTTVIVSREDARADYTGLQYASTSSATSTTATVTLAATIRDITALCDPDVEPTCDQLAGDIANATVTFVNRDTGTALASNVPIGYVTAGDIKTGTATTNVSLSTGTGDSAQYTIGVIVNGYYTRNSSEDDTVVTVAKPVPGVIAGGGNLLLTDSAGLKAGDDGTKNNFGFNIRNERNGPRGTINILVRRTESDGILHTYQIRGNAMTSLVSSVANGTASFNGKGNIQDITFANDPVDPRVIAVDGNASLQVTMTDGGASDTIAITLWNKTGGLWFASKWNGVKTVEQSLNGGNLQVR